MLRANVPRVYRKKIGTLHENHEPIENMNTINKIELTYMIMGILYAEFSFTATSGQFTRAA